MIATATNQGKVRWMIINGAFNYEKLIEFFESLVKEAGKKILLVLNNLSVRPCKPVKAWVASNLDKIKVFCMPSNSTELNPEERLNADLRHVIRSTVPVRSKAESQAAATDHITDLQNKPERVRNYFQDSFVKYAACYCVLAESIGD